MAVSVYFAHPLRHVLTTTGLIRWKTLPSLGASSLVSRPDPKYLIFSEHTSLSEFHEPRIRNLQLNQIKGHSTCLMVQNNKLEMPRCTK